MFTLAAGSYIYKSGGIGDITATHLASYNVWGPYPIVGWVLYQDLTTDYYAYFDDFMGLTLSPEWAWIERWPAFLDANLTTSQSTTTYLKPYTYAGGRDDISCEAVDYVFYLNGD
jgi:hypothetical protein